MWKIITVVAKRHRMSGMSMLIGLAFAMVTVIDILCNELKYYTLWSLAATLAWFFIAWSETILKYEVDLW